MLVANKSGSWPRNWTPWGALERTVEHSIIKSLGGGDQHATLLEHNVRADAIQSMGISPMQFGNTRTTTPCEMKKHKTGTPETEGAITMQSSSFPTETSRTKYKSPTCPLKWHGGKSYDANWIIGKMPPHLVYVEPFFGSGKVLFARDPDRDWFDGHPHAEYQSDGRPFARHQGCSEIVNDVYGELMNFWDVIREGEPFQEFQRQVNLIPFSQVAFERSKAPGGSEVERAAKFFIRNRLSRQGLGRDFATMVRNRTRRRMPDPVSAFLSAVEGLPEVHDRLSRVVIFNEDAKDVIQREDNDVTLFYLDPPYPRASRTAQDAYEFEMTDDEHHQLLDVLCNCKGKVILSTYPNPIYDERLRDWNYDDRVRDNKASRAKSKGGDLKTERIWMNF